MYLTEEDYKKIEKWLQGRSVKDSQLPSVDSLNGCEEVAILQKGINKKVNIHQIAEECSKSYFDFYNVTERHKLCQLTLREAISYVPLKIRKPGLVITFLDKDNFWRIVQYVGTSVNHYDYLSHWVDLKPISDNKDDIEEVSWGKKRKILPLNIKVIPDPEGTETIEINPLESTDFDTENTIYVIRYNFDIRGHITLPKNCELHFEGGSIKLWGGVILDLNNVKITGIVGDIEDYIIKEDGSTIQNYATGQMNYKESLKVYTGTEWREVALVEKELTK